jgi:lysophospholipase L1-like esterase
MLLLFLRSLPLLLVAALGGCSRSTVPPAGGDPRFLALGDSYTIGEGVAPEVRWPVQLAALLRERGVPVQDPRIIARTGWTTDELDEAIARAGPRGPFQLVSLLIGVNNQYRGRSVEQYRGEFRGLLRRAIGFAGGEAERVVVLSIPDYGVTPFGATRDPARIARELDRFNAAAREITEELGAHWVDITPVSRARGAEPGMVAPDGLHPSGAMYAEWARMALPAALEALE